MLLALLVSLWGRATGVVVPPTPTPAAIRALDIYHQLDLTPIVNALDLYPHTKELDLNPKVYAYDLAPKVKELF